MCRTVHMLSYTYNYTIVNDDQRDATILAYLFIPNQLYMFRTMSSAPDDGRKHRPKHVELIRNK